MRYTILLCVIVLSLPLVGHTNPANEFVETLPTGCIDWSNGVLIAKGAFGQGGDEMHDGQSQAVQVQAARDMAARNLLETAKGLRMDATRYVSDVIATNEQYSARLNEMIAEARIAQEEQLPDGSVEVTLRMALLGGFLQMMLPEEIKQVEPIRAVNGASARANDPSRSPLLEAIPKNEGIYTGLVVDARGIGAKPAMVPLIVDEGGKQVYGSAFVSREYAVQYGVCEYVRIGRISAPKLRVAPMPLTAKGLRTIDGRSCDIVISNTDAAKLRDASANLGFLKQCRVIIVLD